MFLASHFLKSPRLHYLICHEYTFSSKFADFPCAFSEPSAIF